MAVYLREMLCSLICFLCFFWDALKWWVEQVLSVVWVVQSFPPKKMESERKFHLFQIHILIKRKPQLCLLVQQNVRAFQTILHINLFTLKRSVSEQPVECWLTTHPQLFKDWLVAWLLVNRLVGWQFGQCISLGLPEEQGWYIGVLRVAYRR